jgi:hypothetical protein
VLGTHVLGLLNVSQAGLESVWQQQWQWQWQWQPTCFLSGMWCGEAFLRLWVQGVEVLILVGALFPSSVAPASQQGFGIIQFTVSASTP